MVTSNFMEKLKNQINGSRIVSQNEKAELQSLENEVVTITDYEQLTANNDDGTKSVFYAFTVEEHPGLYYNAGKVLNNIFGACDSDGEDFRGEKVKIKKKTRLANGRTFTPIEIM